MAIDLAERVVITRSGCWEWLGNRRSDGYPRVCQQGRWALAHRVVWQVFYGPIPAGHYVCHRCDNPPCVRPDHLFVGTPSDNMYDAARKGRLALQRRPHRCSFIGADHRGEKNGRAKLTAADIRTIRALRADGLSGPAIASRFGVTAPLIYAIAKRRQWTHVDD